MAKYCKSCGTNNSDIADTCWKCGKALNVGVNQTYAGGNQPYQPYFGGNQTHPEGPQLYSGGNQPYPGGNQNYYPPNGAYDNTQNKSFSATIWKKATSWKNSSLALQYKVWGIAMFIVAFIRLLYLLYVNVEMSQHGAWEVFSMSGGEQVRLMIAIIYVVIVLDIAMSVHCGILFLKLQVKTRGTYIFYGVMYILATIYYVFVLFANLDEYDGTSVLGTIISIPFCIVTTILLFSKISDANKFSGSPNGWY